MGIKFNPASSRLYSSNARSSKETDPSATVTGSASATPTTTSNTYEYSASMAPSPSPSPAGVDYTKMSKEDLAAAYPSAKQDVINAKSSLDSCETKLKDLKNKWKNATVKQRGQMQKNGYFDSLKEAEIEKETAEIMLKTAETNLSTIKKEIERRKGKINEADGTITWPKENEETNIDDIIDVDIWN